MTKAHFGDGFNIKLRVASKGEFVVDSLHDKRRAFLVGQEMGVGSA